MVHVVLEDGPYFCPSLRGRKREGQSEINKWLQDYMFQLLFEVCWQRHIQKLSVQKDESSKSVENSVFNMLLNEYFLAAIYSMWFMNKLVMEWVCCDFLCSEKPL